MTRPNVAGYGTPMTQNANLVDHIAKANQHELEASESFDRCDTDGFLTQWAHGVMAEEHRLQAWLESNGGVDTFDALFDLEGNLVAAKLVETVYGTAWGILETDDPRSRVTRFVGAFPKRRSTLERKGYREGYVDCPAYVALAGGSMVNVRPYTRRKDGGFSRSAAVIWDGSGEVPEGVSGKHRS